MISEDGRRLPTVPEMYMKALSMLLMEFYIPVGQNKPVSPKEP